MAVDLGEAILRMAVDLHTYGTQLNQAESVTRTTVDKVETHGKRMGGGFKAGFSGVVATFGDIRQIGQDVINSLSGVIEAANESTLAELNLAAALKSHKQFTEAGIKANIDWASAQSARLGIDDEVILGIQAQIAQMDKLSGDTLNRATEAVLQWSAKSGASLETATDDVVKALADDGIITRGFRILGLEIDKTGNKQNTLNDIVAKTIDGQGKMAARAASTQGALDKMSVAWGNVIEALGKLLTESPAVQEVLQNLSKHIEAFAKILEGQDPAVNKFIADVKKIIEAVSGFIDFLGNAQDILSTFADLMTGKLWIDIAVDTYNRIKNIIGGALDWIVEKTQKAWDSVVSLTQKLSDIMVGHSIIPDMNKLIVASFQDMITKTGGITAGGFAQVVADAQAAMEAMGGVQAWMREGGLSQTGMAPYQWIGQAARNAAQGMGAAPPAVGGGRAYTRQNPLPVEVVSVHGNDAALFAAGLA